MDLLTKVKYEESRVHAATQDKAALENEFLQVCLSFCYATLSQSSELSPSLVTFVNPCHYLPDWYRPGQSLYRQPR